MLQLKLVNHPIVTFLLSHSIKVLLCGKLLDLHLLSAVRLYRILLQLWAVPGSLQAAQIGRLSLLDRLVLVS